MTDIAAKIAAIPYWYHQIELPGGIVTPGWAPLSPQDYRVPADLTGLRVLDVGAWDGYWTFEALRRGASEVMAIDDFSDQVGFNVQRQRWKAFDLCRNALGYDETRCTRREMSVYDLDPEEIGQFDMVFFFGILYHLRHPLLALDKLAAICTGSIIVESAICDDFSAYNGGFGKGHPGKQMVAEFYPDDQYSNNPTNWWVPNLTCLASMVRTAGFQDIHSWKLMDAPQTLSRCRGFVSGVRP